MNDHVMDNVKIIDNVMPQSTESVIDTIDIDMGTETVYKLLRASLSPWTLINGLITPIIGGQHGIPQHT